MALGQVVDRLVTEFVLKDDYTAKAGKITASTAAMQASIGSLAGRAGFGTGTAGIAMFGGALTVANAALSAFKVELASVQSLLIGSKIFNMAQPFLQAAAAVDTLKRQLGAMLGSAKAGEGAFKWIQKYGLTSGMEDAPLQEAMRTILMSGRRPGQYLPMLETLALMGGGGDMNGNMMEMSSIFRRLVGGQIADALGPEGLGRFGVNRGMLQQYGASFDNQGRFQGTVDDALAVLERMVALDPRLKDLKASMDSSLATRLSNLSNAFTVAKAAIGESIGSWLVPKLEMLGSTLTKLARSGKLNEVLDKFLKMFGLGGDEGMAKGMVTLVVAGEMIVEKMGDMRESFIKFANVMIDIMNKLSFGTAGLTRIMSGSGFKEELDKRVEELWKKMMSMPSESVAEPLPTAGGPIAQATSSGYLRQIAENTKSMEYNMQRLVMGSGELGRLGATPVELKGLRNGKLNKAVELIGEYVIDEMSSFNRGMNKARLAMS